LNNFLGAVVIGALAFHKAWPGFESLSGTPGGLSLITRDLDKWRGSPYTVGAKSLERREKFRAVIQILSPLPPYKEIGLRE